MTIDAKAVLRLMAEETRRRTRRFDTFAEIGSTNSWLLEQAPPPKGCFDVALADHQTAGRGRLGRGWISPPGSGLTLSLAHAFGSLPARLSCLTLAAGVGIAERLRALGAADVALKWPNDLVLHGRKLAGILTETRDGGRVAVVGVGLNVALPDAMRYGAAAKWKTGVADLAETLETLPDRAVLAAAVIEGVAASIMRFERDGFHAFHSAWRSLDWLAGRSVTVELPGGRMSSGTAEGIDADGALLLKTTGRLERVTSGTILAAGRAVASA